MIALVPGNAVARLLERVTRQPDSYAEVTMCAPFIDAALGFGGSRQCRHRQARGTVLSPSSRPGTGRRQLRTCFGNRALPRTFSVVVSPNLHAKAYITRSRLRFTASEALITSANMTQAAISRNDEIGVLAIASSLSGRALYAQVSKFLRQLIVDANLRHI